MDRGAKWATLMVEEERGKNLGLRTSGGDPGCAVRGKRSEEEEQWQWQQASGGH